MSWGSAIDPGERDRLVTIEQLTDGADGEGFPTEAWASLANTWMSKRDLSGRERFAGNQWSASVDVVFEMPWSPEMDPETVNVAKARRLTYQGRTYDITRPEMRGRRDGIVLYCLARTT